MPDATPEAEAGTEELPAEFENRAARRAKGKKTTTPPVSSAGGRAMRSGTVQSPRQYGNRRSG